MTEMNETHDEITNLDAVVETSDQGAPSLSSEERNEALETNEETAPLDQVDPQAAQEITELRNEISKLRQALAEKEREQETALRELEEFNRLFPDISVKQVPQEVWESVNTGIPLSAAYALYEKKSTMAQLHAQRINQQNASMSAGKAGKNTSGEYFSPDEVRAMSQKQVRENYKKIIESMKSWS